MNPFESSRVASGDAPADAAQRGSPIRRMMALLVGALVAYHAVSAMTLPFANAWWIGELPVLAAVQLPKMYLLHAIQSRLIGLLPAFGWASGSASPDLIATHPWALGLMFVISVAAAVLLACFAPRGQRRKLIAAAMAAVLLDAVVTVWFDSASRLSLF